MAPLLLLALSSLLIGESLASPKVVSLPVRHGRKTWLNATASANEKRAETVDVGLQNLLAAHQYFAIVGIGSPPQTLEILIDTGSSDTWVFEKDSCRASRAGPCVGGEFDPSASSSYKNLRPQLGLYTNRYGDGSEVAGPFFSDKFTIGDATVDGLTMGLVQKAKGIIREGIIGVGYDTNEGRVAYGHKPYLNLPDELVKQDLIRTRAFSLYLDDLFDSTGSILFGGYDTEKFVGDIHMLPLQIDPLSRRLDAFYVPLTGLGISSGKRTLSIKSDHDPYPIPVLLDSGTENIELPLELIIPLIDSFKLKELPGASPFDPFEVSCDLAEKMPSATVVFGFGSANTFISVPLAELIVPLYSPTNGSEYMLSNNKPFCRFGVSAAPPGSPIVLGQTFLRSAYVLYDLDNKFVGVAQAKLQKDSSNVVEYTGRGRMPRVEFDTHAPKANIVNYAAKTYVEQLTVVRPEVSVLPTSFPVSYPSMSAPTSVAPTPASTLSSSDSSSGNGGSSAGSLPLSPMRSISLIIATTIFGSLLGGVYLL